MAAQPITGGLAPDLTLYAGCVVRIRAISPTTGATVSGVQLSNVQLFVRNVGGSAPTALESGVFKFVPGPQA